MAVLTTKKQNFVNRLAAANLLLLQTIDALAILKAEWDANAYATGANPSSNNITDADLSDTLFNYMTASQLNSVIGAHVSISATVASNRGYLEAVRG